jgi:hypothetical protein
VTYHLPPVVQVSRDRVAAARQGGQTDQPPAAPEHGDREGAVLATPASLLSSEPAMSPLSLMAWARKPLATRRAWSTPFWPTSHTTSPAAT